MTLLQSSSRTAPPSTSAMLRLCTTVVNIARGNPGRHSSSFRAQQHRLVCIGSLTAAADSRKPSSLASNTAVSSSSFGLSLESLEAYVTKRAERNQHQKRVPTKRRMSRRPTGSSAPEPKSFDSLSLSSLVKLRLRELGLITPTDVQSAAIPVLLSGDDAAIQSYTGSGKTLAYLLPILSRIGPLRKPLVDDTEEPRLSKRGIEAVVVAPSRELAMQIVREAERILGSEHKKTVQQLVGGANRTRQEEALKKNKPLMVVGTPGRISEISRDGKLHTHTCKFLILDEVDELLSIQFREDMRRILEHVGRRKSVAALQQRVAPASVAGKKESNYKVDEVSGSANVGDTISGNQIDKSSERALKSQRVERQTVLVSATMPTAVLRVAAEWGQKPLLVKGKTIIDVENASPNSDAIEPATEDVKGVKESMPPSLHHFYALSQLQHRVDTARKCIHAVGAKSVIVFMNHPRRLKDTVFKFESRGITAAALHGELGKLERTNTLAAFRSGKIRVLVASEVGARGIDVPECDLVVNLELPTDMTHYAHRAGRTGRLGRSGIVVSICEDNEAFVLKKFQRQLNVVIQECEFVKGGMVSCKAAAMNATPLLVKA